MINEIDVKDFKDIDCTKAYKALTKIDNSTFSVSHDARFSLFEFIKQVETLQRKYTKPVAALLRADNG